MLKNFSAICVVRIEKLETVLSSIVISININFVTVCIFDSFNFLQPFVSPKRLGVCI